MMPGEDVEVVPGRELALASTVSLAAPVEALLAEWAQYQELTNRLLDESDYQKSPDGKKYKKKSAWRKYARAFNLTDRVVTEHVERDLDGYPQFARVVVRATAPNGRTAEAGHECHRSERCCPGAWGEYCFKAEWERHRCCAEACSGRAHWAHPGDITETALTRAKNRAISDLIGAGEVSAEEMDNNAPPTNGNGGRNGAAPVRAPRPLTDRARVDGRLANWGPFWRRAQELRVERDQVLKIAGVDSIGALSRWTQQQADDLLRNVEKWAGGEADEPPADDEGPGA